VGLLARREPPAPGALFGLLVAVIVAVAAAAASAAGTTASPDGAWTYFTEPRAINHDGKHRRTYVGWIDSRGQIVISSYDHRTHVRTRTVLRTGERVDDHNNPSVTVRPDGRLLVFYSTQRRRNLIARVSRRPESLRAWRRPREVARNIRGRHGYTYPNPMWLRRERRPLFLFWRGGSFEPTFSTSTDGTSWSRARKLIDGSGQRPYLVFDSNGRDRIDIAFSDGNPSELRTSIYYMRYRNRRLHQAGGGTIAPLGALPVQPSDADVVYRGGGSAPPAWAYDVGVGDDGQPVVLYATFPSAREHHYHYARWTGSRWSSHEITLSGPTIEHAKGDANYAGGLILDSRDPSSTCRARWRASTRSSAGSRATAG
jgi:BNR repeat-containing family member